jgi:ring-1,2-phenylacetyl-CoA epoxidase subunit PaaD
MVRVRLTDNQVLDLISDIPDPEIPVITIRELGMLQGVKSVDDHYVVTITPTYTGCPAMGMLEDQIRERLHEFGIDNVKVDLVYHPNWTTDWISEEARDKMRRYGISPPEKAQCNSELCGSLEMVHCPICNSSNATLISKFGSTACKALYKCGSCGEPFEHFKCH